MGLRINTNIASLNAQINLDKTSSRLSGNYSRLSSGLRITAASDDAAGLALSEKMRAKIKSYEQSGRNAQDGISLVQTAEGALEETGNLLNRIASTTEFNGVNLLDGSTTTASIQVGINASQTVDVALQNATSTTLAINSISTTSVANANLAITAVDAAVTTLAQARGKLGASQNRLQSAFSTVQTARENTSAAESRIRDVDFASETADLTRNTILQQAATSVLQQANVQPQLALSLLRG